MPRATAATPRIEPGPSLGIGGAEAVTRAGAADLDIAGWAWRLARHLGAVVLFGLPAVVLWWHVWDGHLASALTCACGDAGQTVWFTAWPAYALRHGLDPLFSGVLQAPYGVNLLDNASAVPVGLVLAPLTWVAGPVASTNVALTLCPALSAWACWVACRRLVRWWPAAVVAGLLYGYSPFVVENLTLGHVSIALLVVPPLLALGARELLVGPARARTRWGVAIGILLALQFLLSGEVLAVLVVAGTPAAVVAWLVAGPDRPPPAELGRALGAGALVGAALLALPVWLFLAGAQHLTGPLWHAAGIQGNSLAGVWDPGRYRAGATTLQGLGGYEGRRGPPSVYLGPVTLAVLAAATAVTWRRRSVQVMAAAGLVALTCSFGIVLFASPGHVLASWMPWRLVAGWPLLADVVPQRFSLVVDLSVALVIGIGIDRARRAIPRAHRRTPSRAGTALMAAALVVCLATWWTFQVPLTVRSIDVPTWFRVDAPRLDGTTVLTYPFPFPADGGSGPMVWQAVDGMRFRLAGGYVKTPAPGGRPLAADPGREPYAFLAPLSNAAAGPLPRLSPAVRRSLLAALRRWHVRTVVVTDRGRDPALAVEDFTSVLGRPPVARDGAWVWRLGGAPPKVRGCAHGTRPCGHTVAPRRSAATSGARLAP